MTAKRLKLIKTKNDAISEISYLNRYCPLSSNEKNLSMVLENLISNYDDQEELQDGVKDLYWKVFDAIELRLQKN